MCFCTAVILCHHQIGNLWLGLLAQVSSNDEVDLEFLACKYVTVSFAAVNMNGWSPFSPATGICVFGGTCNCFDFVYKCKQNKPSTYVFKVVGTISLAWCKMCLFVCVQCLGICACGCVCECVFVMGGSWPAAESTWGLTLFTRSEERKYKTA